MIQALRSRSHQAVPRDELDDSSVDDGRRRHHPVPSGASPVDQDASGFRILSYQQFGNPGQANQEKPDSLQVRNIPGQEHQSMDMNKKWMACRFQLSRAVAP